MYSNTLNIVSSFFNNAFPMSTSTEKPSASTYKNPITSLLKVAVYYLAATEMLCRVNGETQFSIFSSQTNTHTLNLRNSLQGDDNCNYILSGLYNEGAGQTTFDAATLCLNSNLNQNWSLREGFTTGTYDSVLAHVKINDTLFECGSTVYNTLFTPFILERNLKDNSITKVWRFSEIPASAIGNTAGGYCAGMVPLENNTLAVFGHTASTSGDPITRRSIPFTLFFNYNTGEVSDAHFIQLRYQGTIANMGVIQLSNNTHLSFAFWGASTTAAVTPGYIAGVQFLDNQWTSLFYREYASPLLVIASSAITDVVQDSNNEIVFVGNIAGGSGVTATASSANWIVGRLNPLTGAETFCTILGKQSFADTLLGLTLVTNTDPVTGKNVTNKYLLAGMTTYGDTSGASIFANMRVNGTIGSVIKLSGSGLDFGTKLYKDKWSNGYVGFGGTTTAFSGMPNTGSTQKIVSMRLNSKLQIVNSALPAGINVTYGGANTMDTFESTSSTNVQRYATNAFSFYPFSMNKATNVALTKSDTTSIITNYHQTETSSPTPFPTTYQPTTYQPTALTTEAHTALNTLPGTEPNTPARTEPNTPARTEPNTPARTVDVTINATSINTLNETVSNGNYSSQPTIQSTIEPTAFPSQAHTAPNTSPGTALHTPARTTLHTPARTVDVTINTTSINTLNNTVSNGNNSSDPTTQPTTQPTASTSQAHTAFHTPAKTAPNTSPGTAPNTPPGTAPNTPARTAPNTSPGTAPNTPARTAPNTPARTAPNTPAETVDGTNATQPSTPSPRSSSSGSYTVLLVISSILIFVAFLFAYKFVKKAPKVAMEEDEPSNTTFLINLLDNFLSTIQASIVSKRTAKIAAETNTTDALPDIENPPDTEPPTPEMPSKDNHPIDMSTTSTLLAVFAANASPVETPLPEEPYQQEMSSSDGTTGNRLMQTMIKEFINDMEPLAHKFAKETNTSESTTNIVGVTTIDEALREADKQWKQVWKIYGEEIAGSDSDKDEGEKSSSTRPGSPT